MEDQKLKAKLLIRGNPLILLPELAAAIGLNEAIVLQQVHYWCRINARAGRNFRDGHYWVYNSIPQWHSQFPWWKSEGPVKAAFRNLENRKLLISGNYNRLKIDRTKWYRVNYDAVEELETPSLNTFYPMDQPDPAPPIPETNPETTAMNKRQIENGSKPESACGAQQEDLSWLDDLLGPSPFESALKAPEPKPTVSHAQMEEFYSWYHSMYALFHNVPHPQIKKEQKERVEQTLMEFAAEHNLEVRDLKHLATLFFNSVRKTDHNINHFATKGILENRLHEVFH